MPGEGRRRAGVGAGGRVVGLGRPGRQQLLQALQPGRVGADFPGEGFHHGGRGRVLLVGVVRGGRRAAGFCSGRGGFGGGQAVDQSFVSVQDFMGFLIQPGSGVLLEALPGAAQLVLSLDGQAGAQGQFHAGGGGAAVYGGGRGGGGREGRGGGFGSRQRPGWDGGGVHDGREGVS